MTTTITTDSTSSVSWLTKFKNGFLVFLTWLKGHWEVIIFLIGAVLLLLFANNKAELYQNLLKQFQNQIAQNKADLDALQKIQQDEIQKQQDIEKKYQDVLDKIQREYQNSLVQLNSQKEKEIHDIIAANHDDPDAMASELNSLLGIPLYVVNSSPSSSVSHS